MLTWRDRLSAAVVSLENGTDAMDDEDDWFIPRFCPCERRSGLSARYMKLQLCSDGALCDRMLFLIASAVWVWLAFSRPSVRMTTITFFSFLNRWKA